MHMCIHTLPPLPLTPSRRPCSHAHTYGGDGGRRSDTYLQVYFNEAGEAVLPEEQDFWRLRANPYGVAGRRRSRGAEAAMRAKERARALEEYHMPPGHHAEGGGPTERIVEDLHAVGEAPFGPVVPDAAGTAYVCRFTRLCTMWVGPGHAEVWFCGTLSLCRCALHVPRHALAHCVCCYCYCCCKLQVPSHCVSLLEVGATPVARDATWTAATLPVARPPCQHRTSATPTTHSAAGPAAPSHASHLLLGLPHAAHARHARGHWPMGARRHPALPRPPGAGAGLMRIALRALVP